MNLKNPVNKTSSTADQVSTWRRITLTLFAGMPQVYAACWLISFASAGYSNDNGSVDAKRETSPKISRLGYKTKYPRGASQIAIAFDGSRAYPGGSGAYPGNNSFHE